MVFVALAGAILSLLASDGQGQTGRAEPELPVSVDRVREGLQRPDLLRPPPEPEAAHFRIAIEEDSWPRETVLDMIRKELGADVNPKRRPLVSFGAQVLASVDLLQLAYMLKDKIIAIRRAHNERNARREVREAIAEFCALHDCSLLETDPAVALPEGILIP